MFGKIDIWKIALGKMVSEIWTWNFYFRKIVPSENWFRKNIRARHIKCSCFKLKMHFNFPHAVTDGYNLLF